MSVTLAEQHEAMGLCLTKRPVASVTLPAFVESRANSRGHTRFAGRKNRKQVEVGALIAGALHLKRLASMHAFVVVRLTRCAKTTLDDDNAVTAMKSIRDGIAKAIGINDRSPRVRYVVDQQSGCGDRPGIEARVYVPDVDDSVLHAAPTRRTKEQRHGEQVEVQRSEEVEVGEVGEGRRPRRQPRGDAAPVRRAAGSEGDAARAAGDVALGRPGRVSPKAVADGDEASRRLRVPVVKDLRSLATPNVIRRATT